MAVGLVDGKIEQCFIEFSHSDHSETADYIAAKIKDAMVSLSLSHQLLVSISSDSGADMKTAISQRSIPGIPCLAPLLHNIVLNTFAAVPEAADLQYFLNKLFAHFRRIQVQHCEVRQTQLPTEGPTISILA